LVFGSRVFPLWTESTPIRLGTSREYRLSGRTVTEPVRGADRADPAPRAGAGPGGPGAQDLRGTGRTSAEQAARDRAGQRFRAPTCARPAQAMRGPCARCAAAAPRRRAALA